MTSPEDQEPGPSGSELPPSRRDRVDKTRKRSTAIFDPEPGTFGSEDVSRRRNREDKAGKRLTPIFDPETGPSGSVVPSTRRDRMDKAKKRPTPILERQPGISGSDGAPPTCYDGVKEAGESSTPTLDEEPGPSGSQVPPTHCDEPDKEERSSTKTIDQEQGPYRYEAPKSRRDNSKATLSISRQRAKKKSKKKFSVKTSVLRANVSSLSHSSSGLSLSESGRSYRLKMLRRQNRDLASSLNERMQEISAALALNNALKSENLAQEMELSELRVHLRELSDRQGGQVPSGGDVASEEEFQRRLVEYLQPVKEHMSQVLNNVGLLTDSLTQVMQLVSGPGRRSRSITTTVTSSGSINGRISAVSPFPSRNKKSYPDLPKEDPGEGTSRRVQGVVAHVSPRVGGHAIQKPQIEIQRLDPVDIRRLQALESIEVAEEEPPPSAEAPREESRLRKRAAAPAAGSLKEPSLNKKMRNSSNDRKK